MAQGVSFSLYIGIYHVCMFTHVAQPSDQFPLFCVIFLSAFDSLIEIVTIWPSLQE